MKSRPVLIIFSTLAGLQVLTAGAALGDVIGGKQASFAALVVAAAQIGMTFYVQNQTVALQDVAAYESGGELGVVAGPAAAPANGVPVQVTATPGVGK